MKQTSNTDNQPPTCTLYYDGQCPLCNREMSHLAKLANENLSLQDIHQQSDLTEAQKHDKLKVLTMVTSEGKQLTGLDANVAAWSHTRYGFILRWLRWPLIRTVADAVYSYWAKRRFEKLYGGKNRHCAEKRKPHGY